MTSGPSRPRSSQELPWQQPPPRVQRAPALTWVGLCERGGQQVNGACPAPCPPRTGSRAGSLPCGCLCHLVLLSRGSEGVSGSCSLEFTRSIPKPGFPWQRSAVGLCRDHGTWLCWRSERSVCLPGKKPDYWKLDLIFQSSELVFCIIIIQFKLSFDLSQQRERASVWGWDELPAGDAGLPPGVMESIGGTADCAGSPLTS